LLLLLLCSCCRQLLHPALRTARSGRLGVTPSVAAAAAAAAHAVHAHHAPTLLCVLQGVCEKVVTPRAPAAAAAHMPYMLIMPPPPPLPRLAVRSKATPNLSVSSDNPLRLCVTPASSRVARVSLYSTRYSLQQQQQNAVCQCLVDVCLGGYCFKWMLTAERYSHMSEL
jgi:hypothetical protein